MFLPCSANGVFKMPRIDPLQLLNCLQVLLSPSGGILSKDEVQRLASLMTKFSKKLVSKCVYVLILKNTERTLLGAFMAAGGWTLIQLWLHDAMYSMNWALVKELLELLLITPVDVERLKSNNIPKLVKSLSKREDLQGVYDLSNQLVQQWLKIVKDETQSDIASQQKPIQAAVNLEAVGQQQLSQQQQLMEVPMVQMEEAPVEEQNSVSEDSDLNSIGPRVYFKLSVKDGKHLISKVGETDADYQIVENVEVIEMRNAEEPTEKEKEKEKKEEKKKSHDKNSNNSGSSKHKSSSSSKSSSSRDKERSNSHRDRDKHSSSKDRSRDKDKRDKDRHRSNGSVKSGSSSSSKTSSKDKKESKEKQAEKDKDTLAKVQPQSIQKLPKIPKKTSDDKDKTDTSKDLKESKREEPKKGTMSVEVRKNNEERPKTVKVYKSKMRSTGLEEEAKPAPPRPTKKPVGSAVVLPPPLPIKRPSPIRELSAVPPEKKPKVEPLERPGSIKLIPPKPKPPVLQESDMFMDALAASATTKKEPKKRKRRASVSKDSTGSSPPTSPSLTNSNVVASSSIGLKNIAPPKFYQDTLEPQEVKTENTEDEDSFENKDVKVNIEIKEDRPSTPIEIQKEESNEEAVVRDDKGLKGVLVYVRRKGPKKSIKWKPDEELVDIQYFELDENERVNVTKTFGDLAKMDVRGEREALQMSRKLQNEDVMDSQTVWRIPIEIELPGPLAEPGSKSFEKDIQFAREKSVLQVLFFNKKMLPDSPAEPEPENYQVKDPVVIPIEDTDNPDHDFRNTPWPEPKGSPPPPNVPNNVPQIFPNVQGPFQNFGIAPPPTFQNIQNMPQQFPGPPFMPQNMMPAGDWNNMNMPNMPNMPNPQMMPRNMGPPEMMNQGPMNPNMFMPPPENFNPMINENPNHRFPPPFNQQGPGPGMFPQNNFNPNRGGHAHGGFRRGGGNGPWLRMNGPAPGSWNNMRGGGGPHRGGGRICNHFRNKGFCKNRDNCPFFHPNN